MNLVELIQVIQKFSIRYHKKVFTLHEIYSLSSKTESRAAIAMTLIRAQRKGILSRVGRFWINAIDPPELSEIAFVLVCPSYLSFESALYHHGVLSQSPRGELTMATSGRSKFVRTPYGNIRYIHLKPKLFFGYDSKRIAYPEKAWLDLLYIRNRKISTRQPSEVFYLKRLNRLRLKKWKKTYVPFL